MVSALRILGGVLIVAGFYGLLNGAAYHFIEMHQGYYQNCEYRAADEGLPRDVSIDSMPDGHFVLWPLGVACDWTRTDGTTATTYESDWTPTFFVYGFLAAGVVGVGALVAAALMNARSVPDPPRG
jgi:hypothetical protein